MKIAGIVALTALLLLFAVLAFKTVRFKSLQMKTVPAAALEIPGPAVERLSQAIRFRTISYEKDQAALADPQAFQAFIDFIDRSFPRVRAGLKKETIGPAGLLYRWQGKNPDLKHILLMAHSDVVPVAADTEARWTHPPFDGVVADGFIWGRGTMDDKQSLMGILEAVERLLADGFRPERGVDLAFGCDEEILGLAGAAQIARRLRADGRDYEFILDEGLPIMEGGLPGLTRPVALIGTSEKGYASLNLDVTMEGGHSSMPAAQTAIGVLGRAISRLEANPCPTRFEGPTRDMFRYVGAEIPFPQKTIFANLWLFGKLVLARMGGLPATSAVVRTTTAPTIIRGGIKDNVLPASAHGVVNFRILPGDSVAAVVEHARRVIADERVQISVQDGATEPSPVSLADSPAFRVLQKTAVEVFPDVLVAPGLMVGATDSRHYIGLSKNIFRFGPDRMTDEDLKRPHGVNERISEAGYKDGIRFYIRLIRNAAG